MYYVNFKFHKLNIFLNYLMNYSNSSLGLYIPNSDYIFQANKLLAREDLVFIISKQNEILVYKQKHDAINKISDLERRFILFTHPQLRQNIFDILIVNVCIGLLNQPLKKIIVTVSENLVLNFWNKKDGLCLNKINLSNHKKKGEILTNVYNLNERFILFICKYFNLCI
jgi:hypothetical protein